MDDLETAKHIFRNIQQNFHEKFRNITGSQIQTLTYFVLDEVINSTSQFVTHLKFPSNHVHSLDIFAHQNHPHVTDNHPGHINRKTPHGQPLDLQLSFEAEDLLHLESEFHGGMKGFQTDLDKLQVHEIVPRVSVMCTRLLGTKSLNQFETAICKASSLRTEPFISIIFIIAKGENLSTGQYRLSLFMNGNIVVRV